MRQNRGGAQVGEAGSPGNNAKATRKAMMSRVIRIAAAQMGGTQKTDPREHTLRRMLDLLEGAATQGVKLLVFPELAFTTFFPRWLIDGQMLEAYFERSMPGPAV